MRFLLATLTYLPFFVIGCAIFRPSSESVSNLQQNHSHADNEIAGGTKHITAFKSLRLTDPEAARAELFKAAKIRYREHPLVDEWVELVFHLSRDGKGSILTLKRVLELEIQMLSDVDAKKHAKQIEKHQESLKEYDKIVEILKAQGDDPESFDSEVKFSIE